MHKSPVQRRAQSANSMLLAPLPRGVPTYSSRHGHYLWRPGTEPVLQIHDDWDIFWIRRGAAAWTFQDGRQMAAGRDDFAILPPFVPAVIRETKSQLAFQYCHFNFRMPPQVGDQLEPHFMGPGPEVRLPLTFSRAQAPLVWRAYEALTRIEATQSKPWRLESAVIDLVGELASFARTRTNSGGVLLKASTRLDPRIARIIQRIESEPAFAWRISDLAASIGLSPGRLHSLFRSNHGMSLKRHIVQTRLRLALKLLKERPDGKPPTVKDASIACGFSSQHFFSRQFSAFFRVSPLAYRNGQSIA
jgi:AraC-like DNA-binding protein